MRRRLPGKYLRMRSRWATDVATSLPAFLVPYRHAALFHSGFHPLGCVPCRKAVHTFVHLTALGSWGFTYGFAQEPRKGNCLNTVIENFFGLLKSEMLYIQKFLRAEHFIVELEKYLYYHKKFSCVAIVHFSFRTSRFFLRSKNRVLSFIYHSFQVL